MGRTHLVLVPGFGGFDALGQLHYYNGVTEHLRAWQSTQSKLALHYFDNLPTAKVATRAKRLRRFLEKLVARDIIQLRARERDRIVLLGHSTGGLDIRQLVRDLGNSGGNEQLLGAIERLVFLSVPQRGTNIADWVAAHGRSRHVLVSSFRQAVGAGIGVPGSVLGAFGLIAPGHSELFDAVHDVACDFVPADPADGLEQADARHARAEVNSWLEETEHDFLAIEDLRSEPSDPERIAENADELTPWLERKAVRSYATISPPPLSRADLDADRSQRSIVAVLQAMHKDVPNTDAVFRTAFAACAGGPFRAGKQTDARWLAGGKLESPLEDWQNDGIVNTASMLLGETWLVPGDHADIIGHYVRVDNDGTLPGKRKYRAYDLLGSDSNFTDETFEQVWTGVFEFATS